MGKEPVSREIEKASKAALRLLRFRPRSVWELSTRLRQKFSEDTCRTVIQDLQSRKLLSDYAFSKFWIENRVQFRPMGRARLFKELLAKGVDRQVIEEALGEMSVEDRRQAEKLFAIRSKRIRPEDPKRNERLYRFLRSRGFSHELVSELLEKEDVSKNDG